MIKASWFKKAFGSQYGTKSALEPKVHQKSKMNHVERNRIHNFIYRYRIKDTKKKFNKIGEVIAQKKFYIYRKTFYIVNNCRIVEEDLTRITVEICLNEHRKLLEDLTNSFFTKKKQYKTSRRKNWARIFCWKSIFDDNNLYGFKSQLS